MVTEAGKTRHGGGRRSSSCLTVRCGRVGPLGRWLPLFPQSSQTESAILRGGIRYPLRVQLCKLYSPFRRESTYRARYYFSYTFLSFFFFFFSSYPQEICVNGSFVHVLMLQFMSGWPANSCWMRSR